MKTHDIQQGTPEWHAFRAQHLNASDAPAMLGVSPYKTRNALLRERTTGITPEVDSATQRLFDRGKQIEFAARFHAENLIGEEFYPAVGSHGEYGASFDGMTMLGGVIYECKTLNNGIAGCKDANDLPEHYRVQMEHQLMVSGAERCLFMALELGADTPAVELWYMPDAALRKRIVDGWDQFKADLENYQPESIPAPVEEGRAPEALPALLVEVSGQVTASNIPEFKERAKQVLSAIKTDLQTDKDFADAEKTTKWCKSVEDKLDAAKQHALSQTTSIDSLFRAIDEIKEDARQKRLSLERLVKQRKESIKEELVTKVRKRYAQHVAGLRVLSQGMGLSQIPDFGSSIKGLKTISSINNALDTALAKAKVEANASAEDIREKMAWYAQHAEGYEALFADLSHLVVRDMDDFQLHVKARVSEQKQQEATRQEKQRLAELAAVETKPAEPEQVTKSERVPTLKLGEINERLGFIVDAGFLSSLGFEPTKNGASKLYHEEDFARICHAIAHHVSEVSKLFH